MREHRQGDGALTASVGAAVLIAMLAFLPIVHGALWWFDSLLLVTAALGAAAVGRGIGLPAAAGALVGLTAVPIAAALIASAWSTAGTGSGTAVDAVLDGFTAAFRQIYLDSVPAQGTRELALLMACGAAAVAVVADFVTVGLRAPIAGMLVVLAVALVPGKAFGTGTNGVLLVAVAAGALGVVAADRRRRGRAPRIGGLAAGGAIAVVVALVAQLVLPAPNASQAQAAGAPLIDSSANPLLRLGQDLRRGVTTPVLSYTSRGDAPVYLRLAVLEDFSGQTWRPNPADGRPLGRGAAPQAAGDAALSEDAPTAVTSITPASSQSIGERLPLPYPAVSVQGVGSDFRWERRGLTLARDSGSTGAVTGYSVTAAVDDVSRARLRDASVTVPPGDEQSLSLPADMPAVIRRTADRWTRTASTPYQQAVAIQNALANGAFSYDEDTPAEQGYDGDGVDVIATFLRVKAGYCIHYASTMALMARLEGIPARIVVGYQPGSSEAGSRVRQVSSDDLHAWPELYFDGIGWVRFEPTPGRGAAPAYAPLPTSASIPTPTADPSTAAVATPEPTTAAQGAAGGGSDVAAILATAARIVGTALAVLLLLAVPGLIRLARRRRRLSRLDRDGPAGAWQEVLDTVVDLGLPSTAGLSPRGAEGLLGAHAATPAGARAALGRLRSAYERQAYSPDRASAEAGDVRRVLEALQERAGPARRVVAAVAPRSLLGTVGVPRAGTPTPGAAGRSVP